ERGQARTLQRRFGQAREELLILRIGAREPALHVVDAYAVEGARDQQLVGDRERDERALRAVAQGRVVHDDPPLLPVFRWSDGHKKTSQPLPWPGGPAPRSEEHTSELQSRSDLVCRLPLEKHKLV